MQVINVTRSHRLDQLTAEVYAAAPALVETLSDGRRLARGWLSSSGDTVTIVAPDDVDLTPARAAIDAHAPAADYDPQPFQRAAARYLRRQIAPQLPGLLAGTSTLSSADSSRALAALVYLLLDAAARKE